ncbi:hypothetical protein IFM89_015572 [Coptis chinensis]|uniref:F-box protein At3g26010-like beta-propeller domain-containing protein n=1 Tax=Coptis chinensis TaxID=261450 RepID=A0A835H4K8_9MAGN|nr:hypothetical protein IFM89_015572 [Coptis chinensis]
MIACQCVSRSWHHVVSTICIPKITSLPVYGLLFNTRRILDGPGIEKGPWSFACINAFNEKVSLPNTSLVESCLGRSLPFDPSPDSFLDCCNGMLLFFDRSSMQFYVCNPSTEQYIAIPNCPWSRFAPVDGALFFDPHFKVVNILGSHPRLNIFSRATGQWSVYNIHLDPCVSDCFWSPRFVFLDGSLYKLAMSGHLMIIDVEQIAFRAIKLPDIVLENDFIGCLGVSQGILHYSWTDEESSNLRVWMLVRRCHSDEWVLKHTFSLEYCYTHPLYNFSWFSVFAFHPTSDMLFVSNLAELFCYDPGTKKLERICRLRDDSVLFSGQFLVFPFSVNLTPLCASEKEIAELFGSTSYEPNVAENSLLCLELDGVDRQIDVDHVDSFCFDSCVKLIGMEHLIFRRIWIFYLITLTKQSNLFFGCPQAIADTPSFIFLWVGDGVGLEQGRQCLRKWGFRRCEDICWVNTNKSNAAPGSSKKPEDMYRIIEHFSLGRRRLELFGEDHNIRSGWLTVGKGLSSSNFNAEGYIRNFCDKDGKVWQGGGGRNPPPKAPHLVLMTTPDIEGLRPKSPIQKNQQQPLSSSLSQTTVTSVNKRLAATSPQNRTIMSLNQEGSN